MANARQFKVVHSIFMCLFLIGQFEINVKRNIDSVKKNFNINNTGTSKVGAISKAQKAQNIFFKKKLEFFSFGKCRIVPKNVKRGDPLGFINKYSVAKYQKTRKGDSFEILKNFRKKSNNAEKKSKGGRFSLVRFCRLR